MLVIVGQVAFISIHSAARAETNTFNNIIVIQINFNPLRREGGDSSRLMLSWYSMHFNPLRREGGDIELHRTL